MLCVAALWKNNNKRITWLGVYHWHWRGNGALCDIIKGLFTKVCILVHTLPPKEWMQRKDGFFSPPTSSLFTINLQIEFIPVLQVLHIYNQLNNLITEPCYFLDLVKKNKNAQEFSPLRQDISVAIKSSVYSYLCHCNCNLELYPQIATSIYSFRCSLTSFSPL